MMNANDESMSRFGKHLQMFLIVFLLLLLSMKKYFVYMEGNPIPYLSLSPSLCSMNDIRCLKRPRDVPEFGLLNDLLWSDPNPNIET